MNKNKRQQDRRAKYVQKRVSECNNTSEEVRRLAKELFLSERTIERDLKRNIGNKAT
jgi:hypothetical protein